MASDFRGGALIVGLGASRGGSLQRALKAGLFLTDPAGASYDPAQVELVLEEAGRPDLARPVARLAERTCERPLETLWVHLCGRLDGEGALGSADRFQVAGRETDGLPLPRLTSLLGNVRAEGLIVVLDLEDAQHDAATLAAHVADQLPDRFPSAAVLCSVPLTSIELAAGRGNGEPASTGNGNGHHNGQGDRDGHGTRTSRAALPMSRSDGAASATLAESARLPLALRRRGSPRRTDFTSWLLECLTGRERSLGESVQLADLAASVDDAPGSLDVALCCRGRDRPLRLGRTYPWLGWTKRTTMPGHVSSSLVQLVDAEWRELSATRLDDPDFPLTAGRFPESLFAALWCEARRGAALEHMDKLARDRRIIEQTLLRQGSNRTATAQALGISRSTLYEKMRRLGIA